jgi:hypothetical protein
LVEAVFDKAFREAIFRNIVGSNASLQIDKDLLRVYWKRQKVFMDSKLWDILINLVQTILYM